MTPEAQNKIRGVVELAMSYVVEPKPLEVPTASGTIEDLVTRMTEDLTLAEKEKEHVLQQHQQQMEDEEVWDGETFGVRLAGLAKLFSNDITKVSLACKPPADSKTVIGMMEALAETCFRLAGFVETIPVRLAGQTYKFEIQLLSNNIFLATAALLNEFLEEPVQAVVQLQQQNKSLTDSVHGLGSNVISSSMSSTSAAESGSDVYLRKTGIVWEACQIFEKASRSNRQAVAKKWGDMMATMGDAISEVQEMIDSNGSENDINNSNSNEDEDENEDDSGNESDDSWNDDEKLTEEEKQLSIRANTILKLTKMLFRKLQQRCLDVQPPTTTTTATTPTSTTSQSSETVISTIPSSIEIQLRPSDLARMWDQLYDRARGIVALADEIATSLYSPQDPDAIAKMLKELSQKNHDCILVGRLFVRGQIEHEKWMDMCEAQTQKILGTIEAK
ncbi:hypothetical protein BG004_003954 [Podila humilis]|nr:hypothetical protein BG004_003954 [Podila humilis]